MRLKDQLIVEETLSDTEDSRKMINKIKELLAFINTQSGTASGGPL